MTDEPIKVHNLDFSQFHDLMHLPFTPYCLRQYGGPLRHVSLWWEFVAHEKLRKLAWCRCGRHRWVEWSRTGSTEKFFACRDCLEPKLATYLPTYLPTS